MRTKLCLLICMGVWVASRAPIAAAAGDTPYCGDGICETDGCVPGSGATPGNGCEEDLFPCDADCGGGGGSCVANWVLASSSTIGADQAQHCVPLPEPAVEADGPSAVESEDLWSCDCTYETLVVDTYVDENNCDPGNDEVDCCREFIGSQNSDYTDNPYDGFCCDEFGGCGGTMTCPYSYCD